MNDRKQHTDMPKALMNEEGKMEYVDMTLREEIEHLERKVVKELESMERVLSGC